jgi:AcrR family transcriptional regulator
VEQLERLVRAARHIAGETGSAAFTVQQVCRQAGVSLKGFYACFASKDDLLVALLEEDSRLGAAILTESVDTHSQPQARVHAYVESLFELLTHPGALGYAGVLVREHRRLSEQRPEEMRSALAPLIDLLAAELDTASRAGVAGSREPAREAQTVFALLLEGIHDVTIGRAQPLEEAAYLWWFCSSGLGLATEHRELP